jgi:hypothetical protein
MEMKGIGEPALRIYTTSSRTFAEGGERTGSPKTGFTDIANDRGLKSL